jgi:hypothetical protein
VLGLLTTKHGELELRDELMRRIDDAARYLPLDQLAFSPQSGFAFVRQGNPLTEEQRWRKLELVSEVAKKVWKHQWNFLKNFALGAGFLLISFGTDAASVGRFFTHPLSSSHRYSAPRHVRP